MSLLLLLLLLCPPQQPCRLHNQVLCARLDCRKLCRILLQRCSLPIHICCIFKALPNHRRQRSSSIWSIWPYQQARNSSRIQPTELVCQCCKDRHVAGSACGFGGPQKRSFAGCGAQALHQDSHNVCMASPGSQVPAAEAAAAAAVRLYVIT
jgi:hypothetical protein